MSEFARLEKQDGVAIITMDDAATRNANSTPHMIDSLCSAIDDVNTDASLGAVVFTGAGPAFSSGGEVKLMESFQQMSAIEVRSYYVHHGIQKLTRAMLSIELPAIAAVNGGAFGSGFGMALMCDLRIASTQASFTMNFAKLGILPGDGGALFLLRALGHQRAAQIMFTAQSLTADAALELGLVLKVVPPEELMATATGLAREIAAHPAHNLRLMKRLLRHAHSADMDSFLDLTVSMQALSHHTPEHRAGLQQLRDRLARKSTK
jgi:2-(1,2-epoxy-1,2-dihydrophenyl)acetyl-CoA isomerase